MYVDDRNAHTTWKKQVVSVFDKNYDNSVINGPIALKLRMQVGTDLAVFSCATVVVLLHVSTCKGHYQVSRTTEYIALK